MFLVVSVNVGREMGQHGRLQHDHHRAITGGDAPCHERPEPQEKSS